jgi:hypothetical protein
LPSARDALDVPTRRAHGQPDAPYNGDVAEDSPDVLADRLRVALDLCALGEGIHRAQLRRQHPAATDDEIEAMIVAWYETRPGAEHGDSSGRPVSWPRPPRP